MHRTHRGIQSGPARRTTTLADRRRPELLDFDCVVPFRVCREVVAWGVFAICLVGEVFGVVCPAL